MTTFRGVRGRHTSQNFIFRNYAPNTYLKESCIRPFQLICKNMLTFGFSESQGLRDIVCSGNSGEYYVQRFPTTFTFRVIMIDPDRA